MASTASSHYNGGLSIPRIKKVTFADSIQHVSLNNRDVQTLLHDVSKNCLDVNFIKGIDILQVSMVHNTKLQSKYVQKRAEMKESGRSSQTLIDQLGFRFIDAMEKQKIAKNGLFANEKLSKLGKGDCGVYLTRYFDVEVKTAWGKGHKTLEIFIFKYFPGRCKSLKLGVSSSDIEPTPNYDSHVGNLLPNLSDALYLQFRKSLIYLYEYTDECLPLPYPRHCLPYAVIKVRKKSRVEDSPRTVVPRVIPIATSVTEPPCDHPTSETSKVNHNSTASSKVNHNSTASSREKLTPLLAIILDSGQESPTEGGAKGSVNISANSGEAQDVRSEENNITVIINGVESKSQRETKTLPGGATHKASPNRASSNSLKDEYLKRLDIASKIIEAEKHSKMLDVLKFIPSGEPEASASHNSSSTSYVTKTSLASLPRAENQASKCSPFLVPVQCHNSLTQADRFASNTPIVSRHAHTSSTSGKPTFHRSASTNEGSHRNNTNFCPRNQNIDPRLLKRSQSSGTGNNSNLLPSDNTQSSHVEARRFPIKSALKNSKSGCQSGVKRIITISEYKQLKAREQVGSPLALSASEDPEKSTDLSSILEPTVTCKTKDSSSQNSSSMTTQQSQKTQSGTPQLNYQTTIIKDKLPQALNSDSVSAAAVCRATSLCDTQTMLPTSQRRQGCESDYPVGNGQSTEVSLQEPTKSAASQIPGRTSNIFDVNFQCLDPSPVNSPEPDKLSFNLDTYNKHLDSPLPKGQFSISVKDSLAVKQFLAERVQKGQLSSPKDSPAVKEIQAKYSPDIKGSQVVNNSPAGSNQKGYVITSVKDSPVVKDSLAENNKKGRVSKSVKNSPASNDKRPVNKSGKHSSVIKDSSAIKDLLARNVQKGQLRITVKDSPALIASDGDSTNKRVTSDKKHSSKLVTSDMGDASKLVASDVDDSDNLVTSDTEDTDELLVSDVDDTDKLVTSDIEDTSKFASSDFLPIHSATASINQHTIITPIPWRHDQDLTSDSEYSQDSADEYDSCVEDNQLVPEQLSESDFARLYREQYGDTPLPKSVSMRDVGIDCYLLALSDMDYQPLTIVVDCFQAKYKKSCNICETSLQNVPQQLLNAVECLPETEEQTSDATALCGSTLENQTAEDSIHLPEVVNYSSTNVNQSNACGKPGIVSVTDSSQAGLCSNTEGAACSSPVIFSDKIIVATTLPGVSLEVQAGVESSRVVSSLETTPSRESIARLAGPSEASCSDSQPKNESCSTNATETTLSSPTSQSNSVVRSVGSKDIPETAQKPRKKISLVGAYSDTDSSNSDEDNCRVTKPRKENSLSSKLNVISNNPRGFSLAVKKSRLKNEINKNAELHTSKAISGDKDLDANSEEDLRERLLEETYLKGSLTRKIADQNVLKDKSNNMRAHTPNKKHSNNMDSSSDEETLREHLLTELYEKAKLERTNLIRQTVNDTSNLKTETLDKIAASDNRAHQDVKQRAEAIFPRPVCIYKSGSLRKDKQRAASDNLARDQNHSAVSHTLTEDKNKLSNASVPLSMKPEQDKFNISSQQSAEKTLEKGMQAIPFHHKLADKTSERDGCAKISSLQTLPDKTSKYITAIENSNLKPEKDMHAKISLHQTFADKTSQCVPAAESSNMKLEKDLHAKIALLQTFADKMSQCAPSTESSNLKLEKDECIKVSSHLGDKTSQCVLAAESSNMKLGKDLQGKITSHQTLADKTSMHVPATESSHINCKQNSFPEKSGTQEVQSITKEKLSLDSQCATQLPVQERERGSIGGEVQVSSMTKVEQMQLKAKNSADKNHLLDQKKGATLSASMAKCTENSWSTPAKRIAHIKPDNTSSGVKLFLEKVRNGVEVKKHIDEEFLAFQKSIEETNKNAKSRTHKQTVANKAFTDQNKNVTIPETVQQGSQMCGRSISTAFVNSQGSSGRSTVLPTAAVTWKDPLTPQNRIETVITNNSKTSVGSCEMSNLVVGNNRNSLHQCDVDYRIQPDFPTTAVSEQRLLQLSYGDEDFRAVTRQNFPAVQQNFPAVRQNFPAVRQNFVVSTQARLSTNNSEQWKQWKQRMQNPSCQVQLRQPCAPYPGFTQQTWVGPQNSLANAPIIDTGNTFMVDEDYRHVRPEGQMPMTTNAVLFDCHRPADMGVTCSAAAASLPARQRNLQIEQFSTFVNCTEAENTQKQNAVTSNNHDSSFWLSSKRSNTDNISGLGFETAGSKVSGIPGLGDVVTKNYNDGEQSRYLEFKATAPCSHETVSSAGVDAKAVWPEIYEPKELAVLNKEKCRSILKSIKVASADADAEVISCKIHIEGDYSDDDTTDSPLPVSHDKENSDYEKEHSGSHCKIEEHSDGHCEIEQHSANVPQKEAVEVPSSGNAAVDVVKVKLLYIHLSNVISRLSSNPNEDSTNKLSSLKLIRQTLVNSHKHILDELIDDADIRQPENGEHDTQAYPTVGESQCREVHDEIGDTHSAVGETCSPTTHLQHKVLLNTNTDSVKIECSEVDTGDVCLKPALEECLVMERQADTGTCSTDSPENEGRDIKQSLSSSVPDDDVTEIILSVSETSPDSPPTIPRSSSPQLPAVTATNLLVVKQETDLSVERRQSESPRKYDRSPVDNTPPQLNSVTTFSEKNIDSPNKFVETKNNSECPPYCKDSTEKLMSCSKAARDVSDDNILPGKETVSDSLSGDPTDLDTPAPSNTTISVNSNGKIYLADVPLMALSIAREKILTEINNLNDPEVASLQKSSELVTIDDDDEDVNILSCEEYGAAPAREIEEGEISSSDSEVLEVEAVPVHTGKTLAGVGSTRKRKPSFYEDEFKKERMKIVKHDVHGRVKKEKFHSEMDTLSGNSMKSADPYLRLNSDVIYISSDAESPASKKTIFDRIRNIAESNDSAVDQKNNTVSKKDATSKANQSDRVFIKSSQKKKNGHEIYAQTQKSENKVKSEVKKKEGVIDNDLSDVDSISCSEWESDFCDNKKSGPEIYPKIKKSKNKVKSGIKKETVIDNDLSLDSISAPECESDFADRISGSVSDTALLKHSMAAKESKVLQSSPESGRAGRYRQLAQSAENLRTFSIFGKNIVVQVFNEKSLIQEGSQSTASSRHSDGKAQSDNSMSKTRKKLQLDVDTSKMCGTVSDQEVGLTHAEKLLLKASGSNSSPAMAKTEFNAFKQSLCSIMKSISCENKELLPGGSLEPTDDHKLVLPGEVALNVQKLVRESLSCTEIRCQNTHTGGTAEVKGKDTEESSKDIYRNLICKPEQPLKLNSDKRCYRHLVKYSETETESDKSDTLKHAFTDVRNRDRGRSSETETEMTDSYSDRDTYRNSMSPSSTDSKRRQTERRSYDRSSVSPFRGTKRRQTDRSYDRKSVSPSFTDSKRRQTDRRSYDRSSSYSRKRRRSSSSSSSYSRKRSLSRRNSRSSSPLSRDRSYHRTRHCRQDKRSSSSSRHRSRCSKSSSPFSSSRRKRLSSPRNSSSRYNKYRRSVSSSRSRDSSTSDGYRRYRSKSPSRYSGSDSHSTWQSSSSKKCKATEIEYYSSKSKVDKLWCQVKKRKNQHPFDMLYSITNMNTQQQSGAVIASGGSASKPVSSAPKPVSSAPKPVSSAPKPLSSAPTPLSSAPTPLSSAPTPLSSAPTPLSSAPTLLSSAPTLLSSAPKPLSSAAKPLMSIAAKPLSSAAKPLMSIGAKPLMRIGAKPLISFTTKPLSIASLCNQNPTSSKVLTNEQSTSDCQKASDQVKVGAKVVETNITVGENGSVIDTHGVEASRRSDTALDYTEMLRSRHVTQSHPGNSKCLTIHDITAVNTSSGSAANLSSQNPTSSKVLTNASSTSGCQKASDQVKVSARVDATNRTVRNEGSSVIDPHTHPVEACRRSGKAFDYSEMLRAHRQAQSHPGNLKYLKTHNVTVKELIISQLGISITDDLKSALPYSVHAVLSDRHYSKEEQQRRCFEIIQCCMKFLKIPTDLVARGSIEPVINSFGNPPFTDRLEHFSDDQILLEINVIKKCQCILDQQQAQVMVLSSYIKLQLGSQLNNSMLNKLGTYSGEPLPEGLEMSVQDFTFIVPKEVIPEDIALGIKDSLEESIDTLLELFQLADFGRAHFRLPEILLLEEEKFQRYSEGNCFLTLSKSLPKKVFTRLLTLKKRIESLAVDPQKSEEEKYACSRQLIGERVSVLMQHVGSVTHKRINKLRTQSNHLMECKNYVRRVIGFEGYRQLMVFENYICALRQHYDSLNDEYINQSYTEYYD